MSCPWIIAMISTGYLTQPWGILAIMSVTSIVIGNIVRTELADIFVHFSVRRQLSAKFSDIAISKYINGFNVFSKATCDPMPFTQICCNTNAANVENCLCIITDTSLAPSPHKPSAETPTKCHCLYWLWTNSMLKPLNPSDAPLRKLAVRLHVKEAAGHGSALTSHLYLLSLGR